MRLSVDHCLGSGQLEDKLWEMFLKIKYCWCATYAVALGDTLAIKITSPRFCMYLITMWEEMRWKDKNLCDLFSASGLEGQYWMSATCEAVDEIFVGINSHDGKILSEMFQSGWSYALKAPVQNKKTKISLHNHQTLKRAFLCMLTGTYFRND